MTAGAPNGRELKVFFKLKLGSAQDPLKGVATQADINLLPVPLKNPDACRYAPTLLRSYAPTLNLS